MYELVLAKFAGVQKTRWGWSAKCPAHDDNRRSLTARISPDGNLWLKCHAGCSFDAITKAASISAKECFMDDPVKQREIAAYDYRDEKGNVLFQVVRFDPKGFSQRTPNGSGWKWGLNGARRVLYRLPDVLKSGERNVLIVEGEKDVDRLFAEKFIATCNPMGAGKWSDEYSELLRGRSCIVIPDNDTPGREHAQVVLRSLKPLAKKAVLLTLPGQKDVSEWFNAGHTAKELIALCKEALGSDVRELISQARNLDRKARWLAVRQMMADLEAEET